MAKNQEQPANSENKNSQETTPEVAPVVQEEDFSLESLGLGNSNPVVTQEVKKNNGIGERPAPVEKYVYLKRKPQNRMPDDIYSDSMQSLGGQFSSITNDVLRGLSFEEEDRLLPALVGVSADSEKFVEAVRNYWAEIEIQVPIEGKRLNISGRYVLNKEETAWIFVPIATIDYIQYRFALASKNFVVENKEDVLHHPTAKFYIEDVAVEIKKEADTLAEKLKVREIVIKYLTQGNVDVEGIKAVLTVLQPVHKMFIPESTDTLKVMFNEVAEKFPTEFYKTITDNKVKFKAFALQLLEKGIIKSAGNAIFDEKIGIDPVAQSMEEYVLYLIDPKNVQVRERLKTELKTKR